MNPLAQSTTLAGLGKAPGAPSQLQILAEKMIGKELDPGCRDKLLKELTSLPEGLLRKLESDGVQFITVQGEEEGDGKKTGGYFDPKDKKIALDLETFKSEQGRAVLCHEIGHAIDWGRVQIKGLKNRLAMTFFAADKNRLSENSPELAQSYQKFQAKELASWAGEARTHFDEAARNDDPHQLVGKKLSSAFHKEGVYVRLPGGQGDVLGFQHQTHRVRNNLFKVGVGVAAVAGGVLAGGIPGLLLGAIGLIDLERGVHGLRQKEQVWEHQFGDVKVKHDENMTAVIVPPGAATPEIQWTANADYVGSSNRKEELFAEGVSAYLTSAESRQKLAEAEPELYKVVESSLQEFIITPQSPRP
ncbi:MAG: hypothetical protein U0931_14785 [Vulcanimicrobiota bacterium]